MKNLIEVRFSFQYNIVSSMASYFNQDKSNESSIHVLIN